MIALAAVLADDVGALPRAGAHRALVHVMVLAADLARLRRLPCSVDDRDLAHLPPPLLLAHRDEQLLDFRDRFVEFLLRIGLDEDVQRLLVVGHRRQLADARALAAHRDVAAEVALELLLILPARTDDHA